MTGSTILLVYGAFMILGGIMGARKGSKASLYAGGGSGVVLMVAGWICRSQPTLGLGIGLGVTVLLCGMTGMRLAKTKKFMPSGMLLAVSLVVLALLMWVWTG